MPGEFDPEEHPLTGFVSNPDFFSAFVALVAGVAGMLSLTSAKSGALIGVLVSVTTIPAAANVGVASALGAWGEAGGAAAQLAINLVAIVVAGVVTLYLQRRLLRDPPGQAPLRPGARGRRPAARPEPAQQEDEDEGPGRALRSRAGRRVSRSRGPRGPARPFAPPSRR